MKESGKISIIAVLLVSLVFGIWFYTGWPQIWHNPRIPSEIKTTLADGATDAMMVYDTQNGTSTPKYRIWDGSSWGSELSATDVSGTEIRWLQVKYAPTRDEAIMVVLTNTGQVQAQVFNGSSWGSVTTLATLSDSSNSPDGGSLYRGFDIEYEQSSGDAIVVAADGTADPNYYVWNGSSWSSGTNIDVPTTGRPYWIELASRPNSDEMAMILLDSNTDVYGLRWTGSAWDNMGDSAVWDATAAIATRQAIDAAFETSSGDIMFIWGDATSTDQYYRTYSGSTLSSATLLDNAQAAGVSYWLRLAPNPTSGSDQILFGVLDAGDDLNTFMWDGSAWSAVHAEHDAATENGDVERDFDIVFETHSSNPNDAWLLWSDGATVSRKLWDGATQAWQTATTMGDDSAAIVLNAHPNSGAVFALIYEDDSSATDDIRESRLTGGSQTWSSLAQIWDGPVKRNVLNIRLGMDSQKYGSSTEAMMVYDTNTSITYPQYRRWTGSSWGSPSSASAINGELRHIVLKAAPTRNEMILVTVGSTGEVQAQIWDGETSAWGSPTLLDTIANVNNDRDLQSLYRGFDVEYENSSGDAIVVTGDGTADPNYHVWNGTSWSGATNIDIPTTGRPNWIELAADPDSDNLALILVDSNIDVYGLRWTGSAWDNMGASAVWDTTAAIATEKCIDAAFETNSGDIMFIWGDSVSTDQYYRTYSGGTLSSATLLDNAQAGGVNNWMRLAPNPASSSDQIMYGVLDGGSDLNTFLWDGSAWSAVHSEHTAGAETHAAMTFDIAFETHTSNSGDAWLVFGNGSTISRRLWNGASWETATTQGDDTSYIALDAHPNSGAFFMVAYESSTAASDDITENHLTGGSQTWGTAASIWGGPVIRVLPYTLVAIECERYIAATISVSISDGSVSYGIMPANTSKSTLSGELNDMQTATNDGNVIENFNIKGMDASGGGCTWTLASTNGSDQYVHQFCNDTDLDCSSPPTNYTALTTTYQTLDTGIPVSGTVDIQLRLTTPNPSSCFGQQSVDVTVQAVQP